MSGYRASACLSTAVSSWSAWWTLACSSISPRRTSAGSSRWSTASTGFWTLRLLLLQFVIMVTHTHTHPFNSPLSGTTRVSRYQKGKTNLDFTEARDREWQWHQLGHMQICTSLQTNNHASTPPLSFLQARCPSCRPANSVKALKAIVIMVTLQLN